MRFKILCCLLLTLFANGCRQEAATNAATDKKGPERTARTESDHAAATDAAHEASPTVEFGAIALTVPSGWERKPASSTFVAAEFVLPRAAGDDFDGRVTVSTAGGSVEANIDRWKGQFEAQPKAAVQEEIEVSGLNVTIVDIAGDFNDQRGPFAPGERRPNHRMIGAVIPFGGQLHFIKATGPQETIASHQDAIHQFIRSVRPAR